MVRVWAVVCFLWWVSSRPTIAPRWHEVCLGRVTMVQRGPRDVWVLGVESLDPPGHGVDYRVPPTTWIEWVDQAPTHLDGLWVGDTVTVTSVETPRGYVALRIIRWGR
jgi:hypothetical protein